MAIYGVRNKYSDCDYTTIQVKKLKDKKRQQARADAVIHELILNGTITYGDDYYAYLLWEE